MVLSIRNFPRKYNIKYSTENFRSIKLRVLQSTPSSNFYIFHINIFLNLLIVWVSSLRTFLPSGGSLMRAVYRHIATIHTYFNVSIFTFDFTVECESCRQGCKGLNINKITTVLFSTISTG